MKRKVPKAFLTITVGYLAISGASLPAYAQWDKSALPPQADSEKDKSQADQDQLKLKGTIQAPKEEETSGAATQIDPELLKNVQLWLTMKWAPYGISMKADPVLGGVASNLPEHESRQMVKDMYQSTKVQNLVTDWRAWYQQIFQVIPKAIEGKAPPKNSRLSLKMVVSNQKKITVLTNWSEGNAESQTYNQKLIDAFQKLNGQEILSFPPSSSKTSTEFELTTGSGFDDIELRYIGNLD